MQRLITPAAVAVTVCLAIAPDATALPPSRPIAPEPTIPPDTSLDTLPVAYYGAQVVPVAPPPPWSHVWGVFRCQSFICTIHVDGV